MHSLRIAVGSLSQGELSLKSAIIYYEAKSVTVSVKLQGWRMEGNQRPLRNLNWLQRSYTYSQSKTLDSLPICTAMYTK